MFSCIFDPDITTTTKSNIMKAEILKAISERKSIVTYDLKFTSYRNYYGEIEYRMNSNRNFDKWQIYQTEKEYLKAIMQRVNYYTKKGFAHCIEIN